VVIEECKNQQRERLVQLCGAAGYTEPERLAEQLFLCSKAPAAMFRAWAAADRAPALPRWHTR
jgi:hypothetical protein